jgi:hypothetical protein
MTDDASRRSTSASSARIRWLSEGRCGRVSARETVLNAHRATPDTGGHAVAIFRQLFDEAIAEIDRVIRVAHDEHRLVGPREAAAATAAD